MIGIINACHSLVAEDTDGIILSISIRVVIFKGFRDFQELF